MTCIFHIVRFDPSEDVFLEGFVGQKGELFETYDAATKRVEFWRDEFPGQAVDIVRKA